MDLSATLQPFVVGGSAAILASCCCHPVDLAKVRLQLFSTQNPGVVKPGFTNIIATMIKKEGFFSIYSGLSASIMRQAVYGTARIGLHRAFSDELVKRNKGENVSFALKTLSGMASGSIAVCIGTPFDVSLVRMQADSMKPVAERRGYTSVFNAIYRVTKEEGVAKLYSGLMAGVLRGMSVNVGMLACYDQATEFLAANVTHDKAGSYSIETRLGASMIAGFTTTFVSLPFDLVKSRLQDGAKYKGIIDVATKVVKNEGILAFWTGFSAYYMRTAPHAMIILLASQPILDAYKAVFRSNIGMK